MNSPSEQFTKMFSWKILKFDFFQFSPSHDPEYTINSIYLFIISTFFPLKGHEFYQKSTKSAFNPHFLSVFYSLGLKCFFKALITGRLCLSDTHISFVYCKLDANPSPAAFSNSLTLNFELIFFEWKQSLDWKHQKCLTWTSDFCKITDKDSMDSCCHKNSQ